MMDYAPKKITRSHAINNEPLGVRTDVGKKIN